MRTLRLLFSKAGASFDLVPLEGDFECSVQNALVNLGSVQGGDKVFPDKGTDLLKTAVSGALFDLNSANHASNYAALDTLAFSKAADYQDNPEPITGMTLKPATFTGGVLTLDVKFTSSRGRTSGVITTLT